MRINPRRRTMLVNMVGLTILFVGYLVTTGTGLLYSDGLKSTFRLSCILIMLGNLFVGGGIKPKFLLIIFFAAYSFAINQSTYAINIIYLALISASLYTLTAKDLATTIFIPTAIVIVFHLLLLTTGNISIEITQFYERSRSSVGFINPNQASVVYLSLVQSSVLLHIEFKRRVSFFLMASSCFLALSVFFQADSRTSAFSTYILLFLLSLNYIFANNSIYRLIVRFSGLAAPTLAVVTTAYLTYFAGTDLDESLSSRPYLFSHFMSNATALDIFTGWQIDDVKETVDNTFLVLLSAVGIISFIVIFFFVSIRYYKMRLEYIPLAFTMISASIFESFLMRPEIPSSVLFISLLFSPFTQKPKLP